MTNNNPLIQKWEELNKKKEESPPKNTKAGYELDPDFVEKLKDVETLSTVASITGNTGSGITAASNYISTTNSSVSYTPYRPLKTYDTHSIKDAFMQVADKVKSGTAIVSNLTIEMDMVGSFAAGKKMTFEIYVYD